MKSDYPNRISLQRFSIPIMTDELKPKRPKGIYLLPNLLTTAALFSGFYAIVAAINDRFEAAAIAIFISMLLDGMDGRVARLTNTQSEFGAEYDSLADLISFGLAPALLMYEWSLSSLVQVSSFFGKLGWLAAFVYTAAAALRLARFNTQVGKADKSFFQGLASPAAAAVIASFVWLSVDHQIDGASLVVPAWFMTVLAGFLMVSKFDYHSFKDLDLKEIPFVTALVVVMVFVLVSIDPPKVLFLFFLLYAISGPLSSLIKLRKSRISPPIKDDKE